MTEMDLYFQSIIKDLKKRKVRDFHTHEKSLETVFEELMPKKTRILSRHIKKIIFKSYDTLNVIIIAHLYIERLLNEILDKKLKDFKTLQEKGFFNTFYKKVLFLKSQKFIDENIADDIIHFNKLRNKFAHRLNYDICDFDLFQISFLKPHKDSMNIKLKRYKSIFNRILIKHILIWLEHNLTKQHSFLFLIDIE